MAEQIPDLVPDDLVAPRPEPAPVAILRAQADRLAEKTRGVILAELVPFNTEGETRGYGFNLVVPALDDYRYQVFTIQVAPTGYPAAVFDEARDVDREARDRAEFIDALRDVFSSDGFKKVVSSILEEVEAVTTAGPAAAARDRP